MVDSSFSYQVNTNGVLSFRSPFTQFSPQRFPLCCTPLIAPFWDDVNIRRFGNIFYRQTTNATLLQRARNRLQESFPSTGNFTPTFLFIATWDRVAEFGGGSEVTTACISKYPSISLQRHKMLMLLPRDKFT